MKTTVKVVSVALVIVMLAAVLASCGSTIMGTYSNQSSGILGTNGAKYEFKAGGKVAITTTIVNQNNTTEAKYKIEGDKITFTYENDGDTKSTTHSFEKGDGYIKIDGIQYDKQ